jgi:hypothetical protein
MEPFRWIRGAVPVAALALVSAATLARPPVLEAADPPWEPPPCPAAIAGTGGIAGGADPVAWYRLDGVVDRTGTLAGQQLVVGVANGPVRRVELPPESFASGPVGGQVLVGADDGTRSRVSLVDVGWGCETLVGVDPAVVRSALVSPDGRTVVEHRLDRATRADLGIWRLTPGGRASLVVRGLAPDARYGPTFSTDLRWAPDGRLAVTACGEHRCRTRLIDIATGHTAAIGPTGPVIGVTSDGSVIAHAPCEGFPCALVRRAPGGDARVIVERAGLAAMAGDRVVFEVDRGRLASVDARSGRPSRLDAADGLRPVALGSLAREGGSHRPGTALLVEGTRMDGRSARVLPAGDTTPAALTEVVR